LAVLKVCSSYTGLPVLVVASLSLLLGFCNYRYQTGGRPDIQFTNGGIDGTQRTLIAYFNNVGKMIAWRGKAKLFAIDDQGQRADQPFGDADIVGAGPKVFPGFGANISYKFPTDKFPSRMLVCATYFDDNQKVFEQAYLLSVQNTATQPFALIEQLPPFQPQCP
jgi:hypothetical protein